MDDCIVIGAGAAGLAAASRIAGDGRRVRILEARERIGGRILTRYYDGESYELGAEFIHGPAPETREVLRAIGQRDIARDEGTSWVRTAGGTLNPEPDGDDFFSATSLLGDVPSLTADLSLDAYLQRFDRERSAAARMVRAFAEGFDAVNPVIASVRGIYYEWTSGVDSLSAHPSSGYAPLLDELLRRATERGASLQLETPVRTIRYSDANATLETQGETFSARCIIVTVPVALLRNRALTFEPPLEAAKLRAIDALETGPVARVTLHFRERFWEALDGGRYGDAAFFRDETGAFGVYWTRYPQRARTIVAWVGGPRADELLARGTAALVEAAARGFGELFGDPGLAIAQLEAGDMHDWSADPYACGAYSYLRVGGGAARAELGKPLGEVLFFAGEATAEDGQGGTVNGAIVSGYRAAGEVLKALQKR